MIDFHSHILPGIDDGSKSVEQSIEMLKREADQGITHVVCTPHFYARHDRLEDFLARREQAEQILREEMQRYTGLPEIHVGAEVRYFRGISESERINQLTILEKKCIMIEMVHAPWQPYMYQELAQIQSRWGITPVIAHVDRYISPLHTFQIPERLHKLPVMVQANADFFLERRTSGMAVRMLKQRKIHLLGSDCHDLQGRAPNMKEALSVIEERLGTNAVEYLRRSSYGALQIDK